MNFPVLKAYSNPFTLAYAHCSADVTLPLTLAGLVLYAPIPRLKHASNILKVALYLGSLLLCSSTLSRKVCSTEADTCFISSLKSFILRNLDTSISTVLSVSWCDPLSNIAQTFILAVSSSLFRLDITPLAIESSCGGFGIDQLTVSPTLKSSSRAIGCSISRS